ncbi:MAG: hypothetical protein MUO85_04365 [candidate division Zixibacteria bacterium]|nr:hypothetical protein [candidate division Zixibacteria bacterium]
MDKDELNEKLMTLKEYLEQGNIKFPEGLKIIDSLKNVRYGANGKVDPSSVDGLVGSLANIVTMMKYWDELRKIKLIDVQGKYFEILETFFGNPYREMKKHRATPHEVASSVASKESIVKAFAADGGNFEKGISEFWKTYGPVVEIHIQDLVGLKTIFGGDIFPSYHNNILSKTGLYVDTIILPDPMLRVAPLFRDMKPARVMYYLTKHALSALAIKDLVLANVNPPIAIIAADYCPLDDNVTKYIQSIAEGDVLTHFETAFGSTYKNPEELNEFLKGLSDVSGLRNNLKSPERILFDIEWKDLPFEERWERAQKKLAEFDKTDFDSLALGQKLKFFTIGRMMQINEIVFKASKLRGVPLIETPTSWQYFLWKYEYDQQRSREANPELKNIFLVNALQSEKLAWLGNVPTEALVKLRSEGALNELREIFAKNINEVENADEDSYEKTVRDVIKNIDYSFNEHRKKLDIQSRRTKTFFGYDVTPWIVTGGISIAAASTGNIPLSIISTVAGMIGCSSVRELWKNGKKILEQKSKIQRSPVGILFQAKEKN